MTATGADVLPDGFGALAPFAGEWGGLAEPSARHAYRQTRSMAELAAFHGAVAPRLEEMFAHLEHPVERSGRSLRGHGEGRGRQFLL